MKNLLTIILILSIFLISKKSYTQINRETQPIEANDSSITSNTKVLTYTVYGMDCPGCQGALEKQLKKISWVTTAEANWIKQEVKIEITADSLLVEEEIYKRIKKANFTPVEKKK